MTDSMSKQNTAPSQGDDAVASHIPCPTEPRIVPIVFEVEEDNCVSVCVIKSSVPSPVVCHSRLRHVAEQPFGFDVVPVPARAPDQANVATDLVTTGRHKNDSWRDIRTAGTAFPWPTKRMLVVMRPDTRNPSTLDPFRSSRPHPQAAI